MAFILVVPVLAILALSGLRVGDSVVAALSAGDVQRLAALADRITTLVHELQNERAQTALFLTAPKESEEASAAVDRLGKQHGITDSAAKDFIDLESSVHELATDDAQERLTTISDTLQEFTRFRFDIAERRLSSDAAAFRFTATVNELLRVTESVAASSEDQNLIQQVQASTSFSRAKEAASLEATLLLNVLGSPKKEFEPGVFRDFVATLTDQEAALRAFQESATTAQQDIATRLISGGPVDRARELEDEAVRSEDRPISFTANSWSNAMTGKLNRLRDVEQQLASDLLTESGAQSSAAVQRALTDGAVALAALLLAILVSLLVARSMVQPLIRLRSSALDVAFRSLPESVRRLQEPGALAESGQVGSLAQKARGGGGRHDQESMPLASPIEPVPVDSADEIGQVARAFNAVHREAVRVATEQAVLREQVSTMFINLARRSQLLVDRLIRQIDVLEAGEEDPDRLEQLFTLDHLVTRMRRNDENLLVLAGAEQARRWSEPAPLADVLRAASAEVEQYTRVEFGVIDPVRVLGSSVNDVVHLIAELLENATSFSSPRTSVIVDARRVVDRVIIEIEDRGIGMSPEQLAEANEALVRPPVVNVSVSKRMGLFVVGRLAARHGVLVQLRAANGGGVLAVVTLPANVLEGVEGRRRVGEPAFGDGPASSIGVLPEDGGKTSAAGAIAAIGAARGDRREDTGDVLDAELVDEYYSDKSGNLRSAPATGHGVGRPGPRPSPLNGVRPPAAGQPTPVPRSYPPDAGPYTDPDMRTVPGAHRATPDQHVDPDTVPLPIYESMESEWFRAPRPTHRPQPRADQTGPSAPPGQRGPLPMRQPGVPPPGTGPVPPEVATGARSGSEPDTGALRAISKRLGEGMDRPPVDADRSGDITPGAGIPDRDTGAIAPQDGPDDTVAGMGLTKPGRPGMGRPLSRRPFGTRPAPDVPGMEPGDGGMPPPSAVPPPSSPSVGQRMSGDHGPPVRSWRSPADVGWQAAEAAAETIAQSRTSAGLPRRVPMAQLVPGGVDSAEKTRPTPQRPTRTADAVRGTLSSYRRGTQRGREAGRLARNDPRSDRLGQEQQEDS